MNIFHSFRSLYNKSDICGRWEGGSIEEESCRGLVCSLHPSLIHVETACLPILFISCRYLGVRWGITNSLKVGVDGLKDLATLRREGDRYHIFQKYLAYINKSMNEMFKGKNISKAKFFGISNCPIYFILFFIN